MMHKSPHTQRGMLLLEVLVAIVVFSFAILGLIGLQARAISFSVNADDSNRAALLANEMVATMWAQRTVSNADLSGQISTWQTRAQSILPPYNNTVTATVTNGTENGAPTAVIRLTWKPTGQNTPLRQYSTLVIMP